MTPPHVLTEAQQIAALGVLCYLSDLFTATPREQFSRDEILVLVACVRDDAELFDPDLVKRFQEL